MQIFFSVTEPGKTFEEIENKQKSTTHLLLPLQKKKKNVKQINKENQCCLLYN